MAVSKAMFASNGIHGLVDGQFGSTGKGLFASWLAREANTKGVTFHGVISNAGPNSGHTFYHGGQKHILKQLPTFAVKSALMGLPIPVYLTGGAVIDMAQLVKEAVTYPDVPIFVHHTAAVISDADRALELDQHSSIHAVAGTRSGTGSAVARRILREPEAVFSHHYYRTAVPGNVCMYTDLPDVSAGRYFMEVSQGFSLGIASEFYPKVTSRECTIAQGIADARIPPQLVKKVYMVIRTFPIRVGNVDGVSSGGHYPDQYEMSWEDLGQVPELTTVTQRVRRVFSFSDEQVKQAITANQPDVVLVNFMNYLADWEVPVFQERIHRISQASTKPFEMLWGFGPEDHQILPF